ncbi:MAG: DAK2 domain-containing protein [Oscillospiraceae bacterium]|nr:DAK2 domain-containing protein [Oscillospiraceae bacterium]MBQ1768695.1 DAK2 domain-containing protein [Oscillospiraceae bacterium]
MSVKRVDGALMAGMLKNGLACLKASEEKINILNVFPVADGDTGTNMRLTLENGLKTAKPVKELGPYLQSVSTGMLYGARGNSGVILSQLMNGFAQELARVPSADTGEVKRSLIRAYQTAYNSVIRPVEGTILTVAREGIEHIRSQVTRRTTIDQLLSMYLAEMRKTLAYTPELLSELKEAGVVDSGGLGYITIVEGMLKYLNGEVLTGAGDEIAEKAPQPSVDLSLFNEHSSFIDGYCMEFILQLLLDPAYDQDFRLPSFIKKLEARGNSIVAVQDNRRVKVHIHTKIPSAVMALAQKYGEFISFKLDNMQVQHNEHTRAVKSSKKHVPLRVITVADGDGMRELFSGAGAGDILNGGSTMNTSAQEFVSAFKAVDADRYLVLPNNKNITLAAQQAAALAPGKKVTVLPTRSMVEGYFALAMDVPDSEDIDYRVRQMELGAENVVTLSVAKSAKDTTYHGMHVKSGDWLSFINEEPAASAGSRVDALIAGLAAVPDIEDRETCILFRGLDTDEAEEALLEARIGEVYPDLELSFIYGGQSVYGWLVGLS